MFSFQNRSNRFMRKVFDFQSCGPRYHAVTPSCGAAPPPSKNALGCFHSSHYTSSLEGWYCRFQGLQLGRTSDFSLPGSCVAVSAIANTGHQGRSLQLSFSMFSLCPTFKTCGVFSRQILPISSDEHPKSMAITCTVLEVSGDFWPLWFAYEIFPRSPSVVLVGKVMEPLGGGWWQNKVCD